MGQFDEIIPRTGTGCKKWDLTGVIFGNNDALAMWIADMDFRAPTPVLEAMEKIIRHGIVGYPARSHTVDAAVASWQTTRHGTPTDPQWVVHSPGVMVGAALAIRAVTSPGDGVIVQPPVYPPFFSVVTNNRRRVVTNPLVHDGQKYRFDIDGLERVITPDTKALLLCSPHNPVGRVWERAELAALYEVCLKHGITVISDEIHQDMVYSDAPRHVTSASLGECAAESTVTLVAPSKTFNIPGLYTSASIIKSPRIRQAYTEELDASCLGRGNTMGLAAMTAAYSECTPWLDELLKYLEANRNAAMERISGLRGLRADRPEGTYLLWIDFKEWGMPQEELQRFLVHKAGLAMNDGVTFGPEGGGFARMNLGCPVEVIHQAFDKLAGAAHAQGLA